WDALVFVALIAARRRLADRPSAVFYLYIGLYSVGRFLIESIRVDSFWVGSFRVPQLASLIGIALALGGLVFAWTGRKVAAWPRRPRSRAGAGPVVHSSEHVHHLEKKSRGPPCPGAGHEPEGLGGPAPVRPRLP